MPPNKRYNTRNLSRSLIAQATDKKSSPKALPVLERLEDRTLFSVDFLALPPTETSAIEIISDDIFAPDNITSTDSPVELVVVDSLVSDLDMILEDLITQQQQGRNLEIVLLESTDDGIAKITAALNGQTVSAVHIISHGSASGLQLGATWLTADSANEQQHLLKEWQYALTEDADLLLYGCNLSGTPEGVALVDLLNELTHADIATSNNNTGHISLGADWELEDSTGQIEAVSIASETLQSQWLHSLLTGTDAIDILEGFDIFSGYQDTLNGQGGNDILIGEIDLLTDILNNNTGDFPPDVQIHFVTTGTVNFIPHDDPATGLQMPVNTGYALELEENSTANINLNTVPGEPISLTFFIGGEAGTHTVTFKIANITKTVTFEMPESTTLANIPWVPVTLSFTTPTSPLDILGNVAIPLDIQSNAGTPLIAQMRGVFHPGYTPDQTVSDGTGDDVVLLGNGDDTAQNDAGNDYIHTGDGADTIHDGDGDDTILGGRGNDTIIDGPGNDKISGGPGDDKFYIYHDSPTDENVFAGKAGTDEYYLRNNVHSTFVIVDTAESANDSIILEYDANSGSNNYYLPDYFTTRGMGIDSITTANRPATLGGSQHTQALTWDLQDITAIDSGIRVQGGKANDIFGLAFTDTFYKGGAGKDIVRANVDYDPDRLKTISGSNGAILEINNGTNNRANFDTISANIEYVDFNDKRYIVATGEVVDRAPTITNSNQALPVPTQELENGVSTALNLENLDIVDTELAYSGTNDTEYTFLLQAGTGTLGDSVTGTTGLPVLATDPMTLVDFNAYLDDLTRVFYTSNLTAITDTLTVSAFDPNKNPYTGTAADTPTLLASIPINILHDPVLSAVENNNLVYTENQTGSAISETIIIEDRNSIDPTDVNQPIKSAIVTITNATENDVLSFTDTTNITAGAPTFNAANGTLTLLLTGDDSVAGYQDALRTVTYYNTSDDPDTTVRSIEFYVNDGHDDSNIAARQITITEVNDDPKLTTFNGPVDITNEDTAVILTFADLLSAGDQADVDGNVGSFVVTEVTSGSLILGPNPGTATPYVAGTNDTIDSSTYAYWTPALNDNGLQQALNVLAKDNDNALSNTQVPVFVMVNPVNDEPITATTSVATAEDTPDTVTLSGTDTDGTVDFYQITNLPDNGTLYTDATLNVPVTTLDQYTATAEQLTLHFVPDMNWNGIGLFDFVAIDNQALASTPETASITVTDVNDEPVSNPSNSITNEDTAIAITLGGTDIDGAVASFNISRVPNEGTLYTDATLTTAITPSSNYTATNGALTLHFLPITDWHGTTSFEFSAVDNENLSDSSAETAVILVNAVNDEPVTTTTTNNTPEDTPVDITLSGSDVDGTVDFFQIVTTPANGTLYTDATLSNEVVPTTMYSATADKLTLHFVPNTNWNGNTSFVFTAIDNQNLADSSSETASITVADVNDEPITSASNEITLEDTTVEVVLNGIDIDGTVTGYQFATLPDNGTLYTDVNLSIAVDTTTVYPASAEALTLYFFPNSNWNGATSFTHAAVDNEGLTDSTVALTKITVNAVNDMPESTDANTLGDEDTVISITLSGTDLDGTVDSYNINSLPANGILYLDATLNNAASVANYTANNSQLQLYFAPNADWNGNTSFEFAAVDNINLADTTPAIAYIAISPLNDLPITEPSNTSTAEDTSTDIVLSGRDIDGTVDSYIINTLPDNGILYTDASLSTLVSTSTLYTATSQQLSLHFVPNSNWNGVTSFEFAAVDDSVDSDSSAETAVITVSAVNDEPVTNIAFNTGIEDTTVPVTLSGSDPDGTVESFRIESLPGNGILYTDAALSSAVVIGASHISNTEQLTLYFAPTADWNGDTAFTYTAIDSQNLADATPETANISVAPVNDEPITDVSISTTPEDTPVAITLSGSDIDGTVSAYNIYSLPANGTLYTDSALTIAANTTTQYTAASEQLTLYFAPDTNWNGTTAFSYAAVDNLTLADNSAESAAITITPVNDQPVTIASNNITDEDTAIAITLEGTDIDGTVDSFGINTLPANGTLYTDSSLATAVPAQSNHTATAGLVTLYFVPDNNWNGITSFDFEAIDNQGLSDSSSETAIITVQAVNDEPNTTTSSHLTAEDTTVTITLNGTDLDGTVAYYQINTLPQNGALYTDSTLTNRVTVNTVYAANTEELALYFKPNENWNGSTVFSFTAIDNDNLADTTPDIANIVASSVNDPPVAVASINTTAEDTAVAVTLSGTDVDGIISEYRIDTLPANGTLYTDAALSNPVTVTTTYTTITETQTLYFVPNNDWNGSTTFNFTAIDNENLAGSTAETATITVTPVNDEPITDASNTNTTEDTTVAITLSGSDLDGTIDSFRINTLPANGTLYTDSTLSTAVSSSTEYAANASRLALFFVPDTDWNGATSFEFNAVDNLNQHDSSVETANITVSAINDAPSTLVSTSTGDEDTTITIALNGTDLDGSVESYLIRTLPENGTLYTDVALANQVTELTGYAATTEQLTLYFKPDANWFGITSFDFVAKDDLNLIDASTETAMITVRSINDEPVTIAWNGTSNEDNHAAITLNGTDTDGTVDAFLITTLPAHGTLYTDATLTTAVTTPGNYTASNDQLTLHFMPDENWHGATTFSYAAIDNESLYDATEETASITVNSINDRPTVDNTGNVLVTTIEDTQTEITLTDFIASASAADIDGSIDAMIVQSVSNGSTLLLGETAALASPYSLDNNIIDANNNAYWTPAANTFGSNQPAFDVLARDNNNALSSNTFAAEVDVTDINDIPTITSFSSDIATTNEDTEVKLTFSQLTDNADEADIDGSVDALIVQSLVSGTLRIGTDATSALPFVAGNNDSINANNNAYWTPSANVNTPVDGTQEAFTVRAKDNDDALSLHAVSTTVYVNDINDAPVISSVSTATTLEDMLLELEFDAIDSLIQSDDTDGSVTGYQIVNTVNGQLMIGESAATAPPFSVTNNTIDASNSAYWTPTPNLNTQQNGQQGALVINAIDNNDDASIESATLLIDLLSVNDAPSGTDNTIQLTEDTPYQFSAADFGFNDIDGNNFKSATITQLPQSGLLTLSGTPVSIGDVIALNELNNGELVFSPAANATGLVLNGLGFQVQDDGGTENGGIDTAVTSSYLLFDITPVNDAPQLFTQTLTLDEGDLSIVDQNIVQAQDVDDTNLTMTINSLPQNGQLILNGVELELGDQFTQSELENDALTYLHNGSETSSDSFTVSVADNGEDGSTPATGIVEMIINEVIDPAPVVPTVDPVVLNFAQSIETANTPIESLLAGFDNEFTIELVTAPEHGELSLLPDGNFIYKHGGSAVLTDSFTFRVVNADGIGTEQVVDISIIQLPPETAAAYPAVEPVTEFIEVEATEDVEPEIAKAQLIEPQAEALQNTIFFEKEDTDATPALNQAPFEDEFIVAKAQDVSDAFNVEKKVLQHKKWTVSNPIKDQSGALNVNTLPDSQVSLNDLFNHQTDNLESRHSQLAEKIIEHRELLEDTKEASFELASKTVTLSSGLSVGYVIWLLRGGLLLGSVMSAMPAWRSLDPLPVLGSLGDDDDGDTETLESMVEIDEDTNNMETDDHSNDSAHSNDSSKRT